MTAGVEVAGSKVPIRLKFTYRNGGTPFLAFEGGLWQSTPIDFLKLMPTSLPYAPLNPEPSGGAKIQDFISLWSLLDDTQKAAFPKEVLPTAVTALDLSINTDNVSFSGTMTVDPDGPQPTPGAPAPWLVFESVTIKATCSSSFKSPIFEFAADFLLNPRDYPTPYNAVLTVDVIYDAVAGWTFSGGVDNLNVACLYPLFPDSQSDVVMNVMEGITVSTLQVVFNHSSGSTSFSAQGVIQLGEVELDLAFNRGSQSTGVSEWDFTATLIDNYDSSKNNLGSFLAGVSPALATELPDFISFDIPKGSSITLECLNLGDTTSHFILLSIVVKVSDFEFAFVQINSAPQATGDELPNAQAPKRIFKFTMDKFPDVPGVPMLDTMSQPFDQMDFSWASDDLTRDEVAQINGRVFSSRNDQLVFVEPSAAGQTYNPPPQNSTDKVIMKGCHFQIIVEENNLPTPVLD